MHTLNFYKESGNLNTTSYVIAIALSILLSSVLGYIYSVISTWNPIIYLNVLLTIGVAYLIGFSAHFMTRLTNNRNYKSRIIFVLIFSLFFNFFQWTAFLLFVLQGAQTPAPMDYINFIPYCLNPSFSFPLILEINQAGLWTLAGDLELNGPLWALIWIIELGIIFVLPILMVHRAEITPYSETTDSWYPELILNNRFKFVLGGESFKQELAQKTLETLEGLQEEDAPDRYSIIHLYYEPEARQQYISINTIKHVIDDNGKAKEEDNLAVSNLEINKEIVEALLQRYQPIQS